MRKFLLSYFLQRKSFQITLEVIVNNIIGKAIVQKVEEVTCTCVDRQSMKYLFITCCTGNRLADSDTSVLVRKTDSHLLVPGIDMMVIF